MTARVRASTRALINEVSAVPGMMDYNDPSGPFRPVPGALGRILDAEVRGRYRDLGGHADALLDASHALAARIHAWTTTTGRVVPVADLATTSVALAYARSIRPALVTPLTSTPSRTWRDGIPGNGIVPLPVWERPLRAALTAMEELPVDVVLTDDELPRAASTDAFAADALRAPLGLATVVRAVLGHDLDDVPDDVLLLGVGHSATAQAVSVAAPEVTVTAYDPLFGGDPLMGTWPLVVAGLGRPGLRAFTEAALDSDRVLLPDDVRALLATRDDEGRFLEDLRQATSHVHDDGVLLIAVDDRAGRVEANVAAMKAMPGWTRIRVAGGPPAIVLRHAPAVRTPTGFPRPADLVVMAWRRE